MAVGQITAGGEQQVAALETALAGYGQAGRWDQVLETVRQLTRRGKLAANEADNLRLSAYRQLLARRAGDAEALNALWKSLSADERKKGMLAAPTMTALAEANPWRPCRLASGWSSWNAGACATARSPGCWRCWDASAHRSACGARPKATWWIRCWRVIPSRHGLPWPSSMNRSVVRRKPRCSSSTRHGCRWASGPRCLSRSAPRRCRAQPVPARGREAAVRRCRRTSPRPGCRVSPLPTLPRWDRVGHPCRPRPRKSRPPAAP